MSATLGLAARLKSEGSPEMHAAEMHAEAEKEADDLLRRLKETVRISGQATGVIPELAGHLNRKALVGAIYTHALIHAGLVQHLTHGPYHSCPRCEAWIADTPEPGKPRS